MPVNEVYDTQGKLVGYKYGQTGFLYTIKKWGKAAKLKALMQARAIENSQKMSGNVVK